MGLADCLTFLYNKDTGQFLGRTCKSWLGITFFYIIYYSLLAVFFVGSLSVMLYGLISSDRPHLTGEQSLLRSGPGIGIYPLFPSDNSSKGAVESTLIYVNDDENSVYFKQYKYYTDELIKKYENNNSKICNESDLQTDPTQVCRFDTKLLGLCEKPYDSLLNNKIVCVYLSLNKIFGWVPDFENGFTSIGISCTGQNTADKENLGQVDFYPKNTNNATYGSISHVYFPFIKQKNYVSPVVAMAVKNIKRNVAVLIKCSAKGVKNIDSEETSRFELLFDDK